MKMNHQKLTTTLRNSRPWHELNDDLLMNIEHVLWTIYSSLRLDRRRWDKCAVTVLQMQTGSYGILEIVYALSVREVFLSICGAYESLQNPILDENY